MTQTPYDTGRIKIGCMYTPPTRFPAMTRDDLILQSALLRKGKRIDTMLNRSRTVERIYYAVTALLAVFIIKFV